MKKKISEFHNKELIHRKQWKKYAEKLVKEWKRISIPFILFLLFFFIEKIACNTKMSAK